MYAPVFVCVFAWWGGARVSISPTVSLFTPKDGAGTVSYFPVVTKRPGIIPESDCEGLL